MGTVETARLAVLHRYRSLATEAEPAFDTLAELAALVCEAPEAAVTFFDRERQWCGGRFGCEAPGLPRAEAPGALALERAELVVIEDAQREPRLASLPRVADGRTRAFAAAPISCDGHVLGTVEIHDRVPRTLTDAQRRALVLLAAQAASLLEARRDEGQRTEARTMDAVARLASGVAHDLNNVLTVVECNTSMLEELASTSEHREFFGEIEGAVRRGAQLSQQLTLVGRGSVGRLEPLELHPLLAELAEPLARSLGHRVTLELDLAPVLPAIRGDATLIEQALQHVAAYCRDAMAGGGVLSIVTALRALDADRATHGGVLPAGRYATVELRDTSAGLAAELVPHIFEPFAGSGGPRGAGLGLAMLYSVVRQHGGGIDVVSTPGRGTSFVLYFPLAQTAPEPAAAAVPGRAPSADETLLVVEDDPAIRARVVRFLRDRGYTVLEAASAELALEVWERHPETALVITDVFMTGRTGRELATTLHAHRPELPILYTSGGPIHEAPGDEPLVEGENFLAKPYPLRRLAALVRQTLDRAALGRTS